MDIAKLNSIYSVRYSFQLRVCQCGLGEWLRPFRLVGLFFSWQAQQLEPFFEAEVNSGNV